LHNSSIVVSLLETTSDASCSDGIDTDVWGNELAVVISHRPIIDRGEELAALEIQNAGAFAGGPRVTDVLMDRQAPTIVVAGHLHLRDCHGAGNVLQIISPALVEDPSEVAIVDVSAEDQRVVTVSFHPVVDDARPWPALVDRETTWVWTERIGWMRRLPTESDRAMYLAPDPASATSQG
jgi:hypothetical protein